MSLLKNLVFISIIGLIFTNCTGDSAPTKQPTAAAATPTPKPATAKPIGPLVSNSLPSISDEEMQNMFNICTNVDFLFYNYSFSMNQTETASIRNTLTYVSQQVPDNFDSGCQPIGRIFFVANGESLTEAEFFLGSVCNYFVFYKDKKKVAANMMTPKGEEFLKNTIQRANAAIPK